MMRFSLLAVLLAVVGCPSSTGSHAKINDPDFGIMRFNEIDAWDCRVEFDFPHPKTRFFAIHLWQYEPVGPTELQRDCMRQLKEQ